MSRCEAFTTFWPGDEDLDLECELEEGHEGPHTDLGLEWEDDED